MTNPIIALCEEASPEQARLALDWYDAARRLCRRIAREHGTTTRRVAAVMAVTSPDCQLVTNVNWTRQACATFRLSRGTIRVGRYPTRMTPLVQAILDGEMPPLLAATGDKVNPFYRGIMGDEDALVLDRWALRLATGSAATTVENRRNATRIYREAADALGMSIRDVQALAWKVARDRHTRRDGLRVRLLDIHDLLEV